MLKKQTGDQAKHLLTGRQARSIVRWGCCLASLLLNAVCVQLFVEVSVRTSYNDGLYWMLAHPDYALAGIGMIFLFSFAALLILRAPGGAMAVTNIFFILLAVVEYYKIRLRGEHFVFWDVAQAQEAAQVIGHFQLEAPSKYLFVSALFLGIFIPCLFWRLRIGPRGLKRIACAGLACFACVGYLDFFYREYASDVVAREREDEYNDKGFLLGFANTMPGIFSQASAGLEEPDAYSEQNVCSVLESHGGSGEEPAFLPDVLFIMSESLYDIQRTGRYELSEDPLAYLKKMQLEHAGGNLITPTYGGGTAHVEYEVLTGYRAADTWGTAFMNRNAVKEGMDSVVTVLKAYGYFTEAMHPNRGSFYDREYAYRALGFDKLLFAEDMEGAEESAKLTPFPSDEYLFEQIILEYEQRPREKPWFCYALTYQNHGGYDYESEMEGIRVTGVEEEKARRSLENYANALKVSDQMLERLLTYFEQQERPVMVVLWGDHSPNQSFFGAENAQSAETAWIDYTTPFLVWSNYGLNTNGLPQTVASYRLGAYALALAGLSRDRYMNYLSSEDAENLFYIRGLMEADGSVFLDEERYQAVEQELRMLHYDRLYGENYGKEGG